MSLRRMASMKLSTGMDRTSPFSPLTQSESDAMNQTDQRTILAAARDKESGAVVRDAALQIAGDRGGHIALCHVRHLANWQRVLELMTPAGMKEQNTAGDDPDKWLAELAKPSQCDGSTISAAVLDGEPGPALVQQAIATNSSLIVVATPREDRIREFFLGSTALAILRYAPCPVLLTRGTATAHRRAMVAVVPDGSDLRLAAAATAWCPQASLALVHCFELPEEGQLRINGYTEAAISQFKALLRQDAEQKLAGLRSAYPDTTLKIENGYAASTLLELVGTMRPDIVVLGAHRGSRTGERFLGSVAQFMIYNADVDLLLVP